MRLKGAVKDVDTLGVIAWGRTPSGAWWPGEALDPHNLPPTRSLPPYAIAGELLLLLLLPRWWALGDSSWECQCTGGPAGNTGFLPEGFS